MGSHRQPWRHNPIIMLTSGPSLGEARIWGALPRNLGPVTSWASVPSFDLFVFFFLQSPDGMLAPLFESCICLIGWAVYCAPRHGRVITWMRHWGPRRIYSVPLLECRVWPCLLGLCKADNLEGHLGKCDCRVWFNSEGADWSIPVVLVAAAIYITPNRRAGGQL